MASITLAGATGLVGSNIYSTLSSHPGVSSVSVIGRRAPKVDPIAKVKIILSADNADWPAEVTKSKPDIFISALGTSRAQAGSLENQRKIDYDLNLALAKAAKESGTKTIVLISASFASATSSVPYSRMKGELEDSVKGLDFEHTVLIKPGLIVGTRDDSRPAEAVARGVANFCGSIHNRMKDFWAQDAEVIGKAAVSAGLTCFNGNAPAGKVWAVPGPEVVRLGRTEWQSEPGL